jgi:hypothetical protein
MYTIVVIVSKVQKLGALSRSIQHTDYTKATLCILYTVQKPPSPNVSIPSIQDKKEGLNSNIGIRNAKYEATIHYHVPVILRVKF